MTQYGVWVTNKPVPFQRHRFATATEMQEGVVDSGDYKVAQNSGGANMSVDVAIGKAWVQIDTGARNGLAFAYSDAQEDPVIAPSNATNPRIDQVVLQYNDTTIPAGVGGDVPTVRVLTGTPTAGATLDNRNGAVALPNDCVRLADILVPAASATVVTANIRDRRPWARGAYRTLLRTAANYTSAVASLTLVDSTNMNPRLECSGTPCRFRWHGSFFHSAANARIGFDLGVDGVASGRELLRAAGPLTNTATTDVYSMETTPAAGSHLLGLMWRIIDPGTGTLFGSGSQPGVWSVEEIVRQNADNT